MCWALREGLMNELSLTGYKRRMMYQSLQQSKRVVGAWDGVIGLLVFATNGTHMKQAHKNAKDTRVKVRKLKFICPYAR